LDLWNDGVFGVKDLIYTPLEKEAQFILPLQYFNIIGKLTYIYGTFTPKPDLPSK